MNQSRPHGAPAIELRNVSCRFISPDGKATIALRDFSMSVAKGEFVAVVGPTGCGKSTTLSMITGLLKPTTGEVRVMGAPVDGIDPRIGFVFQADAVFPWRSVLDNVAAGPLYRGRSKSAAYDEANEWLRRVGLDKFGKHYPHQLSGGMRKRVALADRVFVLTARPATLKKVYEIDLPRPRVTSEIRYAPHFVELSRQIWHDLREEVQIA